MNYYDIPMRNLDLRFDLEKIARYDPPITIAKAYEPQFDNEEEGWRCYAIDVEDNSYWYVNEEDRDHDFEELVKLFPQFSFVD